MNIDLIETLWNVKLIKKKMTLSAKQADLIETLWNVKVITNTGLSGNFALDLIETLWNVKCDGTGWQIAAPRFNRNIVECKVFVFKKEVFAQIQI